MTREELATELQTLSHAMREDNDQRAFEALTALTWPVVDSLQRIVTALETLVKIHMQRQL